MQKVDEGEILYFSEGDVLFNKGDPGGDLYFIQSGRVQIFSSYEGKVIPLSEMGAGEVLGTLTCLTNKERLASARALSEVVVRQVPHRKISTLMAGLPEWMKVVLKDFTYRLDQMNKNYSKTVNHMEYLSGNQISYFYTSAQMASTISVCAPMLRTIVEDDVEAVFPEDMQHLLEMILLKSREEIDVIFQIFIDCGLIPVRIEQDKKQKYFTVEDALKIKDYAEFIKSLQRKKMKRILDTRIANREVRILAAMVRYVEKTAPDLSRDITLTSAELQKNMERIVGQKFDLSFLNNAKDFGLVRITGSEDAEKISFSPRSLSHTLIHIAVYKKLSEL